MSNEVDYEENTKWELSGGSQLVAPAMAGFEKHDKATPWSEQDEED